VKRTPGGVAAHLRRLAPGSRARGVLFARPFAQLLSSGARAGVFSLPFKLPRREEDFQLAITPEFIETFRVVCPACRGRVELKPGATGIKCLECRRVYPVRDDIPALVVEEAVVEDDEPKRQA